MTPAQTAQQIIDKVPQPAWQDLLKVPTHWPAQGDLLDWCQHMQPVMAALLVLIGVIYLLFGFKVFKALVMLNAAAVGAAIGFTIGQKTDVAFPLMVLCGFVAAALTWPLMKWAVAIMGGLCGALLGASVWQTCGLDPAFAWSGALTGMVLLGLLSFIIFAGSVTMYMSLQGSAMLVFGILGLAYKYDQFGPKLTSTMTLRPFILPMAVLIPAIIGMLFQQSAGTPAPAKK